MKGLRFSCFVAVLVFLFCLSSSAEALTIAGTWDYKAVILDSPVVIDAVSYDFSAEETGVIEMNVTVSDGNEYFNNYVITGSGKGRYKESVSSVWKESSYSFGPYTVPMEPHKYDSSIGWVATPRDPVDVFGVPAWERIVLKQTGEHTAEGKIYLTYGDQMASGTVLATRRHEEPEPWSGSSGMCNAGLAGCVLLLLVPAAFLRKRKS